MSRAYIDCFSNTRLPVLACCALSHSQKDGNCGWAWLMQAKDREQALLYSGSSPVGNIREVSYLALAALGKYLGFPAEALLLLPNQSASSLLKKDLPEPWADAIKQYFAPDDPQKSIFIVGPDGFSEFRGFASLQAVASEARRASSEDCCRVLERCPACGEISLNGRCGCQSEFLFFPTFTAPINRGHIPNLVKRHELGDWPERFAIDYRRGIKSCPKCGKVRIPVGENDWKCSHCDAEPVRMHDAVEPMPPKFAEKPEALPARLLSRISRLYPDVWQLVDEIRAENRDKSGKLAWDSGIFLPAGYWKAIQAHYEKRNGAPATAKHFYQLMMAGAWRPTQDIISFDPALYDALAGTSIEGRLPYEQLLRFPAWCVYFDAPGLVLDGDRYDGFFAMLDEAKGFKHLCLYFLSQEKEYFFQPIRLGNWDIREGLLSVVKSSRYGEKLSGQDEPQIEPAICAAINLILYAFTQEHAFKGGSHAISPKRTKKGWRLFPPPKPCIHTLGTEIGESLRKGGSRTGRRRGPRPHIRRGHWHSYWTGAGRSMLDLKWLAPIPVALAETA